MKTSDLIKTLQDMIAQYGDLDIMTTAFDEYGEPEDWSACKVEYLDADYFDPAHFIIKG